MEITEEVNITDKETILEVMSTLRVRTLIARTQMPKFIFIINVAISSRSTGLAAC